MEFKFVLKPALKTQEVNYFSGVLYEVSRLLSTTIKLCVNTLLNLLNVKVSQLA